MNLQTNQRWQWSKKLGKKIVRQVIDMTYKNEKKSERKMDGSQNK